MGYYSEAEIERQVEIATNRYDARLMSGRYSREEYDAAMREINKWAEKQYRNASGLPSR